MNTKIQLRLDAPRGCGTRKPGGLYLVSQGLAAPCGRLPIPLGRCPCCDAGIKPSRGWTWIDLDKIAEGNPCTAPIDQCRRCPLFAMRIHRAGLLWVGEKFYSRPEDFSEEADRLGVSRRISMIPRGFKVVETWVAFAHRKGKSEWCPACGKGGALREGCETCGGDGKIYWPAIFHLFRPTAIEYIVKGTETDEEIDDLLRRGITPVRVFWRTSGPVPKAGEAPGDVVGVESTEVVRRI